MPTVEAKSHKVPAKSTTKLCPHCGRTKNVNEFYVNRDWDEQLGRDLWCRDCVGRCQTKDQIREYFWENHREFTERIWQNAMTKAERLAATNTTYQKSNDDRKQKILVQLACKQVPTVMQVNYKYVENGQAGEPQSYQEAKEKGEVEEEAHDPNVRYWSAEFNGSFTDSELRYLESYYEGLQRDFDLSDTNLRDIARKLAKASLQADKAQNDFMKGACDYSVVKDALSQFDLLSKTGNFAACKKKPGDGTGMNSWSEITLKLETSGHPCIRKIEWEQDDVDKTLNEFRYIVEALQLDSI